MNWRINESGVSATIENIEWERIHLILTVRLHIDGQKTYDIDKMEFYAVNNLGGIISSDITMTRAIEYAVNNGAKVINC